MGFEIVIDTGRCMGNGACQYTAPDIFEVVEGTARVIGEPSSDDERLEIAVDECPAVAISIVPAPDHRQA